MGMTKKPHVNYPEVNRTAQNLTDQKQKKTVDRKIAKFLIIYKPKKTNA
jgi:hypothetical protein